MYAPKVKDYVSSKDERPGLSNQRQICRTQVRPVSNIGCTVANRKVPFQVCSLSGVEAWVRNTLFLAVTPHEATSPQESADSRGALRKAASRIFMLQTFNGTEPKRKNLYF